MYPPIFKGRPILGEAQDVQTHVILLPSSQTEAETALATFQLHHEAALLFRQRLSLLILDVL